MKFYIAQKVFSWNDKFSIKDENGNPVFNVEGQIFSLGKKLRIYDSSNNEVCFISQELLHLTPQFNLNFSNGFTCKIVKKFTLLKPKYEIQGIGWSIDGDFFAHDYVLRGPQGEVARINKVWMAWGDTYELDVYNAEDAITALAVVIAIDAAMAVQSSN